MNDADGRIMTHDDYATRLWIKTKQVKSLRMNHHSKDVKFVRMVSIPTIDRVLLFFTVLRSSEEKGGYIQLMTWNLEPAHQVNPYGCWFLIPPLRIPLRTHLMTFMPVDQAGSALYSQDVYIAIADGADLHRCDTCML